MRDETIRPGDLVMVVRHRFCCKEKSRFGEPFIVDEVRAASHPHMMQCSYCGNTYRLDRVRAVGESVWLELFRLKKINPPALKESTKTRNEVTA